MTQVNKSTKTSGGKSSVTFQEYGYTPDGDGVSPAYQVRITSLKDMTSVVAILQDDIQMRVESRWDPFIPTAILAKGSMVAQLISSSANLKGGPKSLVTKAASRRLWVGTTPMAFSLKLKFEAINDSFRDVVEPCRILQSLALPSEPTATATVANLKEIYGRPAEDGGGLSGVISALPTLTPPGPSPFSWEGVLSSRQPINESNITNIIGGLKGGNRIILQLGQFLKFDDVIVKEVSTAYHIKMDTFGDPISADLNIIFETYEIPTVETLKQAYKKSSLFIDHTESPADKNIRKEFHVTTFG